MGDVRELVVPIRIWQTIDAVLDNLAAVHRDAGDSSLAARADRIRQAGWDATALSADPPSHGTELTGTLNVAMSADDLDFIRATVRQSARVTSGILDDDLLPEVRMEQEASLRLETDASEWLAAVDDE